MAFRITSGNKEDRKPLDAMSAALQGKIFADKGYLSQSLLERLWQRGLHLVNGIGRNMKNHLMPLLEKVLLRKRCIIETLFEVLKSSMGVEHSRQRSPINALVHALVHILSSLAAYTLAQPKVKIGKVPIPGPVPNLPSLSSPYPQLGLFMIPVARDGITCAESTKLAVCQNGRISRNRVLQGLAKRGRSTMGWFFGFKLHLLSTTRGRWWHSGLRMEEEMTANHLRP